MPPRRLSNRMPRLLLLAMIMVMSLCTPKRHVVFTLLSNVVVANALGPAFPFSQEPCALSFTNTSTTLVHFSVVPADETSPSSVASVYVAMGNDVCMQLPASHPCNSSIIRSGGADDASSSEFASLGGASTVRVGDGSRILSVGTATIAGGTGTLLFGSVFAEDPRCTSGAVLLPDVAPVQTSRIGGNLLRVRGLVASDPTHVRYFLIGGTSDVVEEFVVVRNTHNATTTYRWMVPPGGASVPTLIGGGVAVMYPAGALPFAIQTGFSAGSSPSNPQPFFVVSMGRASGPTAATAFSGAVATVFAVAARESYVFFVTVAYLQMVVVQFGGVDGTTLLGTAYTGSKVNDAFCPFTAGVTPFSFGGSFVSADNSKLYVGCHPNALYSTALLTAKVESLSISSANPPRISGGDRVHSVASVVYKNYNDTALLMFSHYDDCAVFIPDGPFPLEGGTALKTKTVELPHATTGTHVFACTTLGFCPATATCTDRTTDIPSCVARNGCMYSAGPDSQVTCCPRSHFVIAEPAEGVAPLGSHWMLAHASPVPASHTVSRSLTRTASHTVSRPLTRTASRNPSLWLNSITTSPTSLSRSLSVVAPSSGLPNHRMAVIVAVSSSAGVLFLFMAARLLLLRYRRLKRGASRWDALRPSVLNEADSNPSTPRDARTENDRLFSPVDGKTPIYSTLLKSNKYTISKFLGKGGCGMVFLATRTSDQRKGALKYITCRTDYDRTLALKEFEVIMKVRHPNIIPIWDLYLNWQEHMDWSAFGNEGKDGKQRAARTGFLSDLAPFQNGDDPMTALARPRYVAIVTQYYPEGDLKRYCYVEKKQGRQLSEERIVSLMTQIATLVVKLHDEAQQIVHRDLKPENILLDCNYHKAVVTDFGLAFNNVNEASHMTTQAGSLPFVAPECWSKYYNAKVDVWSMGCLLYAIATQRVTGDDSRVMFNDVDEVWFEEELRREVVSQGQYSPQLFAILMKLLVKNPAVRPTSYQVECMLGELMEARSYDTMHVVRTPLPRPRHALEREACAERQQHEAEARTAEEALARTLTRQQRNQQNK